MPTFRVTQYYRFAPIADVPALVRAQRALCQRLGLLGRIYVASEGINGTLSGPSEALADYQQALLTDPRFAGTLFKDHDSDWMPFRKLSVREKPEIVALKHSKPVDPNTLPTGAYVYPEEMQHILETQPENVVVLDARSRYEHELGRFKGAMTLDIENFRDLPAHLQELESLKDKTIVTYCTGGVKCEKLTALLLEEGFKDVRQLHGGILHYAEQTGGAHFEGRCYVFDDRVSVEVNRVNPTQAGHCSVCGQPADFPINCANLMCHDRVTVCHTCAEEYQGTCSEECFHSPHRRPWTGTGRFVRQPNPANANL